MKKFLLSILMLFAFVNVNASVKGSVKDIKIENIDVMVSESVGYNEEVRITYSINPRDAKNLELTWSITGLKKGITAEFVNGNTTKESDGEIVLKVNNTLSEDVVLSLKATQDKKVISTTKLNVETKDNTIERVTKELNDIINNLDENLDKNNYEETKANIEKIDKLLEENPEVKDMLDKDALTKYDEVKTEVSEYKENNNAVIIGVSVALVLAFSGLLYWIFKKEGE